ncbi:MAG: UDP-4-amino-4,6-dideoxy-N-acetyl-beta-L-altrosamine transaminase [Nitrospirae bacterium]|nr:UDP-4-amino-4,6-dideoxy-N-acetyl-beta-L-altrosamine transaminase [Nitrospirota bacterium]
MSANRMIPYGRQWVDELDIQAVVAVLESDWLTTGPRIQEFEQAVAHCVQASEAVAVSSGTAALHAAMYAIGIGPGDEVILPPITFVATANAVVMQGGTPVFADVDSETLLLDPEAVKAKVTTKTKAILAVDYAGQPCDYEALRVIADRNGLALVADACHALGASERERRVGSLADLTVFSFHPIKAITTGEGGMVVTDSPEWAGRIRRFRNHGISTDHHQRLAHETWEYQMVSFGMNYRLTDIQCALGVSQLSKLPGWIAMRQSIAMQYDQAFSDMPGINPLRRREGVDHAYHLYIVLLDQHQTGMTRSHLFRALRESGIGVHVHYIPVHLHTFYRERFGTGPGLCPVAEAAYERMLSLPIYPRLHDDEFEKVITTFRAVVESSSCPIGA